MLGSAFFLNSILVNIPIARSFPSTLPAVVERSLCSRHALPSLSLLLLVVVFLLHGSERHIRNHGFRHRVF